MKTTRPGHTPDRMGQFVLRSVIAGIIGAVALAAGIYAGNAFSGTRSNYSPESLTNDSFLEIGDDFPNYALTDVATKDTVDVSTVTATYGAILVFADGSCGACEFMFQFWEHRVLPQLAERIRIVVIYDAADSDTGAFAKVRTHLPSAQIMVTQRLSQNQSDGIFQTPTLVAVDRLRKIRFLSTGFDRKISAAFLTKYK